MSSETTEILLVEDDEGHIELIRRAFKPKGKKFNLTVAGTLAEARKILKKTSPALIIADYLLPDGKGIKLLPGDPDKLTFPIVILTAHGDEKVAAATIKAGAIDYLVKSDKTFADMPHIIERILLEWQHIAECRQMEKRLEESEAKYQDMYDHAPDMFVSVEAETAKIRDCNQTLADNLGYDRKEIIGRPIFDMYHPDCMPSVEKAFHSFVTTGEIHDTELQLKRKDGSKIDVLLNASAVKDENGKVLYSRSIWRDITERKTVEERASGLNRILEESLNEIYIFDAETLKFIQVNYGARLNLGYEIDELRNLTPLDIKPKFTRKSFKKLIEPLKTGKEEKIQFTTVHQRKDGSLYPVEVHLQLSVLESRKVFIAIILDITERKKTETELLSKQRQLKVLLDVSMKINTSLEETNIRKILLNAARSLTNSTSGLVGRVEDGRMVFSEEFCSGDQCTPINYTFKPGYGVPGHVMQTLKPYISNDAEHDPHVIQKIRRTLDFHQLIDVPILNRSGKLLGCFEIHNRKDGRPFDDVDIELLESLAASAAVALENAQLFSDLKQAGEILHAEQEQVRQIIDTARDAFVSMNTDGIITDWNPQAGEIFGWSRDEALGKKPTELFIPEASREAHRKGLKHYLATGEGPILNQTVEITAQHRDGHTFPADLSIVPVHTDDAVTFNAFIRDISARQKAKEALKISLVGTIVAISKAVEARDPYTGGHQQRVARLARSIAQEMGLDSDRIDGLRMGATIHDIGKIHLPAEILSKPTKLTETEFEFIKTHAQVGYDILKDIKFPWPIADIAYQHHERLDGTGYPQGLKGEEICLEARIVAVADVVEAISSHRPYRPSLGMDVALEEIEAHRGEWYEPAAVDACLKLIREKEFSFDDNRPR